MQVLVFHISHDACMCFHVVCCVPYAVIIRPLNLSVHPLQGSGEAKARDMVEGVPQD